MVKDPFKYACIALLVVVAGYWGYNYYFPTKKVYLERGKKVFHSSPVCENIDGFDQNLMEECGKIVGSEEISEEEVYNDTNFKMCDFCFSPFEIKYRSLK